MNLKKYKMLSCLVYECLVTYFVFAIKGASVTILTSLEYEAHVSGVVLIAPAFAPNPETATFVRVRFLPISLVITHFW